MSFYEKYILPRFLNCACAAEPITFQRKKVTPLAEGKVLEVGIGSGLNLPFMINQKLLNFGVLIHQKNLMLWQEKLQKKKV